MFYIIKKKKLFVIIKQYENCLLPINFNNPMNIKTMHLKTSELKLIKRRLEKTNKKMDVGRASVDLVEYDKLLQFLWALL